MSEDGSTPDTNARKDFETVCLDCRTTNAPHIDHNETVECLECGKKTKFGDRSPQTPRSKQRVRNS
jgi:DNA-directed RNA polymerase subunit RPC12/RpoP